MFSDQKMLDMAQGAGEQGWAQHLVNPAADRFNVTQDGVNFLVYVNKDADGNAFIGNVHPVR